MKPLISVAAVTLLCTATVARQPESVLKSETATTLWDKLLDATVQHVKTGGPDADVAQFISMTREAAWRRREELVVLLTPYLGDQNPKNVAGALAALAGGDGSEEQIHPGACGKRSAHPGTSQIARQPRRLE